MPKFTVTIPFAGHMVVEVEAADRASAIEAAMDNATSDNIEGWEALEQFNQGNVCYCPQPWEVVVENEDGEEIYDD